MAGIEPAMMWYCINRIRLEFKGRSINNIIYKRWRSINRIRLEFKGIERGSRYWCWTGVLIESDWNLKHINTGTYLICFPCINRIRLEFKGHQDEATHDDASEGINRIRLEFKVSNHWKTCRICKSINRIRLEFKVCCFVRNPCSKLVLIESDWNLKDTSSRFFLAVTSINRIRLEFKVYLIFKVLKPEVKY